MRSSALLLLTLPFLASCSHEAVSTAKFRGWSLDEFNPLRHAPPVVQVSEETLARIHGEHLANRSDDGNAFHPPVDFTPPTLPEGGIAMDGSLLPSKDGGLEALLDVDGALPSGSLPSFSDEPAPAGPEFSIE